MVKITGANGFVGQNLNTYLKKFQIETNFISRLELGQVMVSTINDSQTIIHLAGIAHDLHETSRPEQYYEVNYELTVKLYDAFLNSYAKQFIFISSVKAAADMVDGVLTEDVTPNPSTHYGKSKLMAEEYIRGQSLPEDKCYYILRPCMIHGPGNKGNLNLLHNFVCNGLPYPLAAFENRRSFLSVENLCFVIKELIKNNDIPSGVYNIADNEELSTKEVVSLLAEALNRTPRFIYVPQSIIVLIARVGDYLKLPLNSDRLGKLTGNYRVSNKKIKQAVKKPLPLSAREGILETARAFKHA